jgi:ATP-dependent protease HslVU (ClpYQ) peptidase subunit
MTTIAWDGKTLAADKQSTWGTTPVPTTKIFFKNDTGHIYGAAGCKDDVMKFFAWMEDTMPEDNKPVLSDDFCGIIIEDGAIFQVNKGLILHRIHRKTWAIGSGADYALGAMAMGADAKDAVDVATQLDINTGLGIETIEWDVEKDKYIKQKLVTG